MVIEAKPGGIESRIDKSGSTHKTFPVSRQFSQKFSVKIGLKKKIGAIP